ncbi:MAG: RNA polymerase sigma factor [Acidobacteriota bacterium]
MSPKPLDDEELVSLWVHQTDSPQRPQWINELFGRYQRRVALWCLRISGDRESAADLAQEVFLKVYRNLASFKGDSKFSTWLFSVTRNHCFNYLKSRARRPQEETPAKPLVEIRDPAGVKAFERIEHESSQRLLRQLMNQELGETERRVMVLHYREELPLEAITRLLALSNPSGAKAYIVSSRRKLKRAVEKMKKSQAAARF